MYGWDEDRNNLPDEEYIVDKKIIKVKIEVRVMRAEGLIQLKASRQKSKGHERRKAGIYIISILLSTLKKN